MSRLRNAITLTFFNLFLLGLIFCSIEVGVRIFIPAIKPLGTDSTLISDAVYGTSRGLTPGASGKSYGVMMHVDGVGFWKYPSNKNATTENILLLGDSVTMGIGVHQEKAFGGLLAAHLGDTRVINPSLIGYSVSDYLNVAKHLLASEPGISKMVIVWCLNDVYAGGMVDGTPDQQFSVARGLIRFLHRNVMSYQWLKNHLANRPKAYYLHDIALYDEGSQPLMESLRILDEITELSNEKGITLEIWMMPYLYQLIEADDRPYRIFKSHFGETDVAVVNLADGLSETGEPEKLYLYGDGIHFSEYGHYRVFRHVKSRFAMD